MIETSITKKNYNKTISLVIYFIVIPICIYLGVSLLNGKKYNLISIVIALTSCIPFFISFEKGKTSTRELVAIAIMTSISIVGRIAFMPLPGFKPVTAIVIITGVSFGYKAGFITGALTALISNMIYGQGPWTPFQMFIWGFIGLLAALLVRDKREPSITSIIILGILGGVIFSLLMDIWTTISIDDNSFSLSRYYFIVLSSLPAVSIYVVSNIVFLVALARPILSILHRIKVKYGIFLIDHSKEANKQVF